jgi:hypothetical protein
MRRIVRLSTTKVCRASLTGRVHHWLSGDQVPKRNPHVTASGSWRSVLLSKDPRYAPSPPPLTQKTDQLETWPVAPLARRGRGAQITVRASQLPYSVVSFRFWSLRLCATPNSGTSIPEFYVIC